MMKPFALFMVMLGLGFGFVAAAPSSARTLFEIGDTATTALASQETTTDTTTTTETTETTETTDGTTTDEGNGSPVVNQPAPADCDPDTVQYEVITDAQTIREHGYTPNPAYYYVICHNTDPPTMSAILNGYPVNCCW